MVETLLYAALAAALIGSGALVAVGLLVEIRRRETKKRINRRK